MSETFRPLPHYGCGAPRRLPDRSYLIEVLPAAAVAACPYCSSTELAGFGRRPRPVADLPLNGWPVRLLVQVRRFRCTLCQRTFYESLPEIDPQRFMTLRLKRWIAEEAGQRTRVAVAAEAGLSEGTVRAVLRDLGTEAGVTVA